MPQISLTALHALPDYQHYKQSALVYLQEAAKRDTVTAKRFFDALDKIRLKSLSLSEKRILSGVYVACAIHKSHDKDTPVIKFIENAVALKEQVGMAFFLKLFGLIPPDQYTNLNDYVSICQLIILLNQNADFKIETWMTAQAKLLKDGAWPAVIENLKATQKALLEKGQLKPEIAAIMRAFSTPSEFVRYPIKPEELERAVKEYEAFETQSQLLLDCSSMSLQIQALEYQKKLQVLKSLPENLMPDHIKMLAIIAAASRLCFSKFPYITQTFAILGLLQNPKGRIVQIRTGEGKSLTLAILAAFLASLGMRVHVITSAKDLAIRDYELYKDFFKLLNLTSYHVCDNRHETTQYDQHILYGTNCDFEFILLDDYLTHDRQRKLPEISAENPCIGLCDEADNFLVDTAGNAARISHPASEQAIWFYEPIIKFVQKQSQRLSVNTELVGQLRAHLNAHADGAYRISVSRFTDIQLANWLEKALEAQFDRIRDIHYVVNGGKIEIVDHKNTGDISKSLRWTNGLHQLVEVKEGLAPKPETLTIASVAHSSYFDLYTAVFGTTGTLGSVERDEIRAIYRVDNFDVPTHRPCLRKTVPALYCATASAHQEALIKEILATIAANRPILLLFISIKATKAFSDLLKERGITHQVLHKQQPEDQEHVIRRAGHAGVVTIATNVAARGTDFILSAQSLANGGLKSVFTFYPSNERVKQQGEGRAGRQGQPGECRMILSAEDDFVCELIPNQEARVQLARDADFLQKLDGLRDRYIAKLSLQRQLTAQRDKALFEIFNIFSKLLKHCYTAIDMLSFEQLAAACAKISSGDKDEHQKTDDIHEEPLFGTLHLAALSLLIHQEQGREVDWISFLKNCKENYFLFIKQEWAKYFTEITHERDIAVIATLGISAYKENLFLRFYDKFFMEFKFFFACPKQCFVDVLGGLLVLKDDYFSEQQDDRLSYLILITEIERFSRSPIIQKHGSPLIDQALSEVNRRNLSSAAKILSEALLECALSDNDRTIAYFVRGNVHRDQEKFSEAESDYVEALDRGRFSEEQKAIIFLQIGYVTLKQNHYPQAEMAYTAALAGKLSTRDEALALIQRGLVRYALDKNEQALADYTKAIDTPALSRGLSPHALANARMQRGCIRYQQGHSSPAEEDLTVAIDSVQLSDKNLLDTRVKRGHIRMYRWDYAKAVEDYTAAISLADRLPAADQLAENTRAIIFVNRGKANRAQSRYDQACADYTAAINSAIKNNSLSKQRLAKTLIERGNILHDQQNYIAALNDYSAVIDANRTATVDSDKLPAEELAKVFLLRGDIRRTQKNYVQAVEDYTDAINTHALSAWRRLDAFRKRGNMHFNQENYVAAEKDYTEIIKSNKRSNTLSKNELAIIFLNRGKARLEKKNYVKAEKDFTSVIKMDVCETDSRTIFSKYDVAQALRNRGIARLAQVIVKREQALDKAMKQDKFAEATVDFDAADAEHKIAYADFHAADACKRSAITEEVKEIKALLEAEPPPFDFDMAQVITRLEKLLLIAPKGDHDGITSILSKAAAMEKSKMLARERAAFVDMVSAGGAVNSVGLFAAKSSVPAPLLAASCVASAVPSV